MASQLLVILASASLVTTGAAGLSSTRAADAFPTQNLALVKPLAKAGAANCLVAPSHGKALRLAIPGHRPLAGNCANSFAQPETVGGVAGGTAAGTGGGLAAGAVVGVTGAAGIGIAAGVSIADSTSG